jgi:hypothetical protein
MTGVTETSMSMVLGGFEDVFGDGSGPPGDVPVGSLEPSSEGLDGCALV